jgi:Holliday junction resolvasome RuvABC ATP-dependent DNA helicase subunit
MRDKSAQHVQIRPKPSPSPIFTGRETILHRLDVFFAARPSHSSPRREYLLYGLGGAGKSQIALKFAQEYQKR